MTEQRNLILFILLSLAIWGGFYWFFERPRIEAQQAAIQQQVAPPTPSVAPIPGAPAAPTLAPRERAEVLGAAPRLRIDTPSLHGSINLIGARIDDLTLADYHVTPDPTSPEVTLLSPAGSPQPYFAEFGWTAADPAIATPGPDARWEQVSTGALTPNNPVTLRWASEQGLVFERTYEIDSRFMFEVTQRVINESGQPVELRPYGLVARVGTPEVLGFYILHEGPVGVLEGTLREIDYEDLQEGDAVVADSLGGWLGFTDKYWLTALIPDQDVPVKASFVHRAEDGVDRYWTNYARPAVTVQPGASQEITDRLFAGAKVVRLLDAYQDELGVPHFDKAVDFGLFYWITRPIFWLLDNIFQLVGNFGVAILILTVLAKAILFPLANKSYKSMSRMKALQPKMLEIRERFADDRQKQSQAMMELYRREKVNPAAGCLPILVQIPIFFSLYKVLFVTIEMRHADFFGWINDLSAPDPTNIFTLFGVLPWDPPSLLHLGVWPLIMGATMWLQQKMNPQPADPTQAKVMMVLPIVFTFMLASFPAGLVIYWAWNNLLSIAQQWIIMRRMGVKIT